MKQFVLAPNQTAISFEELPVINTPRSVTILLFSAYSLVVHIEGRQHLLSQTVDLTLRTSYLPDTLELYSLIGECLCLLSESEFGAIAERTRLNCKLVNIPFAIDKIYAEVGDEWNIAVLHLQGRTFRVSQELFDKVHDLKLGINLFVA